MKTTASITWRLVALAVIGVIVGTVYMSFSHTTARRGAANAPLSPTEPISTTSETSATLTGVVMMGPTCPISRPGEPECADKPYATLVVVFRDSDRTHAVALGRSDDLGRFSFDLLPGVYLLGAGESALPRCDHPVVAVPAHGVATATIRCDTGIR